MDPVPPIRPEQASQASRKIVPFAPGDGQGSDARAEVLRLADAYRDSMQAYAFAIVRSWPHSQDVVQEALIVVYHRWEDYVPGDDMWPWLRRIVQLKAYETVRRRRRNRAVGEEAALLEEQLEQEFARIGGVELQNSLAEKLDALRRCLPKLRPRARDILHDFYVENLAGEEISRLRKIPPNTVWSYLKRSREKLRECIERQAQAGSRLGDRGRHLTGSESSEGFDACFFGGADDRKLEDLIARRPGGYLEYVAEWTAIARALEQTSTGAVSPRKPRLSNRVWAVASAFVAVAVGIQVIWSIGERREVLGATDGAKVEVFKVPDGRSETLFFDGGATQVVVEGGSELELLDDGSGSDSKHLVLHGGSLVADVAPQRHGHHFQIDTENGVVEVIGTRLAVGAGERLTTVGVEEGEVRFSPDNKLDFGLVPISLAAGESVAVFDRLPPVLFSVPGGGGGAPWEAVRLERALEWEFFNGGIEEKEQRLGAGVFRADRGGAVNGARSFRHVRDIVATTPVELPETFTVTSRVRINEGVQDLRTIVSNSAIGLHEDGFRFGFDHADSEGTCALRINLGDGQQGQKFVFSKYRFRYGAWYTVSARVDLVGGTVQLEVDGEKSAIKRGRIPDFQREGALYFGGQEPVRSVAMLMGDIAWIRFEAR